MNELNKKLAEWAGFSWQRHTSEDKVKTDYWVYPDGNWCYAEPPNFTQSLDACFKWLVPKLQSNNCYIQLNDSAEGWNAEIWERAVIGRNTRHIVEAETPALALCKAIEKLIDSEVVSAPSR